MDVVDLGLRSYGPVLELQRELAAARIDGRLHQDVLLLVEHPPVVTLGRSAKDRHLLASPALLATRGVERFEVERGGDVTFHGLGQLVGYPILDLGGYRRDLHWYLRQVEEALIRALATWGLEGARRDGYTGVWTTGRTGSDFMPSNGLQRPAGGPGESSTGALRKIASIGVHAKQWVTWHGFALNVATDLAYFDLIIPCGIAGVEMTSVSNETGTRITVPDARTVVAGTFGDVFGVSLETVREAALLASIASP